MQLDAVYVVQTKKVPRTNISSVGYQDRPQPHHMVLSKVLICRVLLYKGAKTEKALEYLYSGLMNKSPVIDQLTVSPVSLGTTTRDWACILHRRSHSEMTEDHCPCPETYQNFNSYFYFH